MHNRIVIFAIFIQSYAYSICAEKSNSTRIDFWFSYAHEDDLLFVKNFNGLLNTAWVKSQS